jgi:hypothetical protein
VVLPYLLSYVENRVYLSHDVQVTGAIWRAVTRIVEGIEDQMQRTRDGQTEVGYSVVGRLRGQVMLCMVCTVHKETRSTCFLVWPKNRWLWVSPQNLQLQFGDLGRKITATVSWFGPQNQTGYGLLVAPQN